MNTAPMLFKPEMIRAILDGTKTETRRIFKDAPDDAHRFWREADADGFWWCQDVKERIFHKHFGTRTQVGDLIWVKENYRFWQNYDEAKPSSINRHDAVKYEADGATSKDSSPNWGRLRPSIHMPKVFSRLTLRVTGFNIERLHDIDEAGAIAEGVNAWGNGNGTFYGVKGAGLPMGEFYRCPINCYRDLWNAINGPDSWDENPWVTVTKFEVLRQNVGEVAGC